MEQRVNEPFELQGALNVRELGGYRTEEGKKLKTHRLLRSAATDQLTERDLEFLYAYGVRCVIDLRSGYETVNNPSKWQGYRDVAYYNVAMLDKFNSVPPEERMKNNEMAFTLQQLYQTLILDDEENFAKVLRIVLAHPDNCILFNCTAGKDRTGLTAMLLLRIAGVDDATIAADYAASEANLSVWTEKRMAEMQQNGLEPPKMLFGTPPENITFTLALIREHFGSVRGYLQDMGFCREEIEKIRESLLES